VRNNTPLLCENTKNANKEKPSLLPGKGLRNAIGRDSQSRWFEMVPHALSRALSFPLICCAFAIAVSLLKMRDEELHWVRITLHLSFQPIAWWRWVQTSLVTQIEGFGIVRVSFPVMGVVTETRNEGYWVVLSNRRLTRGFANPPCHALHHLC